LLYLITKNKKIVKTDSIKKHTLKKIMNNKKNKKTWNMFPYVIYQIVHEPPNSLNPPSSLHLKKKLTPGKSLY